MAGNLTFFGEVTVGGCIPSAGALFAAMVADLQAQLNAQVALLARLKVRPPSLLAQIDLVTKLLATLRGAVHLNLPGVDFQVKAVGQAIAALKARIALLARYPLGVAGVMAYAYGGTASSFGETVNTTVGPGLPGGHPTDHVNAIILATSIPATWAALGELFIQ